MMEQAIQIAAGAAAGGGFLIWFAKFMASRLIKQYDEKHADHEKRLRDLSEKFAEHLMDLKLKLAKLEPMVISAVALKEDLKAAENGVAVLKHIATKTNADLNQAFILLRKLESKNGSGTN